jgi:ABC-2 type transport system ATP-binding protein
VIEISDLYKYYGEQKAVGPLTLQIEKGEIVGLLGLNGAGKTTTLRILACDLLPSSGTVRVEGVDVVDRPHEVRQKIGYLPDTPPLYGEMTVSQFLTFAAELRGMSRREAERRLAPTLEATELTSVAHQVISSLSHGFKQRVGIAQAIIHKPRLLVLDEPISGLDPVQIVEMRELLKGLRGDHTILISSHILSEISETCDRILVIHDGEIRAAGTEAELLQRMEAGVAIDVTARDREGRIAEVVGAVEGVQGVATIKAYEQGEAVVSVRVSAGTDVREDVARTLVEAGIGLLGMQKKEQALESFFLRLTGDEGAGLAEAPVEAAEEPEEEAGEEDGDGDGNGNGEEDGRVS